MSAQRAGRGPAEGQQRASRGPAEGHTHSGDAAPVRQSRLGQALSEEGSTRVSPPPGSVLRTTAGLGLQDLVPTVGFSPDRRV